MEHQIWALVMQKYPKLPEERNCIIEKRLRDAAREEYYKKLLFGLRQADDTKDKLEGTN